MAVHWGIRVIRDLWSIIEDSAAGLVSDRRVRFVGERSWLMRKIINSILFTYNHHFRDFFEVKKTILQQVVLNPYLLSSDVFHAFSFKFRKYGRIKKDRLLCSKIKNAQAKKDTKDKKLLQALTSRRIYLDETPSTFLKNYEIYLEYLPYIPNQFAQIIDCIYKKLGVIPYLSSKVNNNAEKLIPDTFGVDTITGKIYINYNEIYLKYLIDYFSETKSSVLKSVIIFFFI